MTQSLAISQKKSHTWLDVSEAGTALGIRFVILALAFFGRRVGKALLVPIAFYYTVLSRTARRGCYVYHQKMGLNTGFFACFRHILTFAEVTLDRVLFVSGKTQDLVITRTGNHHLEAQKRRGSGAILLGAHLGSFEAMRNSEYPVYVVGNFRNAKKINRILDKVNPGLNARLIEVAPERLDFVLAAKEAIESGGFLGILGDRVAPGMRHVEVNFLGEVAKIPTGPFLLAHALGCPVYLTFALYQKPNRYDMSCELFAERIVLPRQGRQEALRDYAQRYVDRLEHHCRLAPYNWFNFFDFWKAG